MSRFPDDNYGGVDMTHVDPLERARIALDFEALNRDAPPVKEILYKAQTMGPLTPVRDMWRPRPATLALGFCALLLLAPWLPQRSSLTVMQIGFEQPIARSDADKLAAHLVRNQPENMLLLTEFTPTEADENSYNVPGHLRVRLTAFNSSETEVEEQISSTIRNYQGRKFDPLFKVDQNVTQNSLHSPALLALGLLREQVPQRLSLPDQSQVLADLARDSKQLIATAVAPRIEQVAPGIRLNDLDFGQTPKVASSDVSFTVSAWPEPMNFSVDGYEALDSETRGRVMRAAEEFVRAANLGIPKAGASDLHKRAPIVVTVHGLDGEPDPILTEKVQAWVQQPGQGESLSAQSERTIVERAMTEGLPRHHFDADFERRGDQVFVSVYLQRFKGIFDDSIEEQAAEADNAGAGEL